MERPVDEQCSQAAGNVTIFNVTCTRRLTAWLAMQQCQVKLSQTSWTRQWWAGHLWLKITTLAAQYRWRHVYSRHALPHSSAVRYDSMADSSMSNWPIQLNSEFIVEKRHQRWRQTQQTHAVNTPRVSLNNSGNTTKQPTVDSKNSQINAASEHACHTPEGAALGLIEVFGFELLNDINPDLKEQW